MDVGQPESYRRYRRYFVDLSRFYQKKEVHVYTGIVLSILTVAFFLFFAIRPTIITIISLVKEIKDKRVIAEKLEDKIDALNSAQIEYQRIERKLYLVDKALPDNADLSLYIRQLEALAKRHNVTIESLQFEKTTLKSKEKGKEAVQGVRFSLALTGDYHQLKSFLDTLARLRRLVFVEAFTFQTGKGETRLLSTLNAEAYWMNKEK